MHVRRPTAAETVAPEAKPSTVDRSDAVASAVGPSDRASGGQRFESLTHASARRTRSHLDLLWTAGPGHAFGPAATRPLSAHRRPLLASRPARWLGQGWASANDPRHDEAPHIRGKVRGFALRWPLAASGRVGSDTAWVCHCSRQQSSKDGLIERSRASRRAEREVARAGWRRTLPLPPEAAGPHGPEGTPFNHSWHRCLRMSHLRTERSRAARGEAEVSPGVRGHGTGASAGSPQGGRTSAADNGSDTRCKGLLPRPARSPMVIGLVH